MASKKTSLDFNIEDYGLHLEVTRPAWLFALTSKVLGKVGMHVYKSVVVRDDDEIYAPVAEFLKRCRYEVVTQAVVDDPNMMFGQAEFKFYLVHRKDGSGRGEAVDPKFLQEMHDQGIIILKEMLQ